MLFVQMKHMVIVLNKVGFEHCFVLIISSLRVLSPFFYLSSLSLCACVLPLCCSLLSECFTEPGNIQHCAGLAAYEACYMGFSLS